MEKRRIGGIVFVLFVCVMGMSYATPIISDLPREIYCGERETDPRRLYTFVVTSSVTYTCSITITGTPTAAAGNEFETNQNAVSGEWELWTTGVTFDDTVTLIYSIDVVCTDPGVSATRSLSVEVINNEEVSEDKIAETVDVKNTVVGDIVATVTSTSFQNHNIEFNMTANDYSDYFQVDPSNGNIIARKSLLDIDSTVTSISLPVWAHDTTDHILVYNTKVLNLINQNILSTTSALPRTDNLGEDTAYPTVLFSLDIIDPDADGTNTVTYTCTPDNTEDLFDLSSGFDFRVKSGKSLNYEAYTSHVCSFYIDDGTEPAGPFIYTLNLNDVNERCSFNKVMYHGTFTEGAAGSETIDPGFIISDPDSGDVLTYSFSSQNNSDRFTINPTNGYINFSITYDRDTLPATVILTVYCVDDDPSTPLTGSAQVTITILDINDNAPLFDSTNTVINIDETATAGSSIGMVTVTDADSGSNSNFTCSHTCTSTTGYENYFSVGFDCAVYLTKRQVTLPTNTHVQCVVTATDQGATPLSSSGGLDIFFNRISTTTIATTTEYQFFDHGENVAAFVCALLGGLLLLGLLSFCILKYCCGGAGGCRECTRELCQIRSPKRRPRRSYNDSYYRRDSPEYPRKERPPTYERPSREPYIDRLSNGYNSQRKLYSTRPIRPIRVGYPGGQPASLPGYVT